MYSISKINRAAASFEYPVYSFFRRRLCNAESQKCGSPVQSVIGEYAESISRSHELSGFCIVKYVADLDRAGILDDFYGGVILCVRQQNRSEHLIFFLDGVDIELRKEITFLDSGVPYDPVAKADPDVSLSAEEREIGGLGVFMTKKLMDEVRYEYRDGQNVLTLKKRF